jgi:hypothetical protein
MMLKLLPFREVWCCDFEFTAPPGERPTPLCCVAREVRSGRLVRLWLTDGAPTDPPFGTDDRSLFVGYYASAELGCFLALGWQFPSRVLDLCAEFKDHTSGLKVEHGRRLPGALRYHGLDGISTDEKDEMISLAMRGGFYTDDERLALLNYCQSDVDALVRLLPAMLPKIDMPRALLRGRYMAAAARMEWIGTPIDVESLTLLRQHWTEIQSQLVEKVNPNYDAYVPNVSRNGKSSWSFSAKRWESYLITRNIPWPRLESGNLDLEDDTFRDMAKLHPVEIGPMRELRHALSQLRLNELAVGKDGRNRCLLGAFGSKTGRNQPSNSKFIFGPSTWLRSLIRPEPGRAVAYVDWSAQEFAIAAALSGDPDMKRDYATGDPYLALAKRAKVVPQNGARKQYEREREMFKVCCGLGTMYGAGEARLATTLGIPPVYARALIRSHHESYPIFWQWSDAVLDFAMLEGYLVTPFGWHVHVDREVNPRSLRNFMMQASGAEMLRLACCLATERGINVCAPVHDALLIEASCTDIDNVVELMQRVMVEASELVLPGFPLRTDAKVVTYPERYRDRRGVKMWETVQELLTNIRTGANPTFAPVRQNIRTGANTGPSSLMSSLVEE